MPDAVPFVLCVRRKDVPPTQAIPPNAKTLRCDKCGAKLLAAPSTARHVADGLMRPRCYPCAWWAPANVAAMTAEQAADLAAMNQRAESN